VQWIFRAPSLLEFWNLSCLEIKREKLGEFLHSERAGSHRDDLEQTVGKSPDILIDIFQRSLICAVKRAGQFVQGTPETTWETAAKVHDLTINPSEPILDTQMP
jgi:hypothetical protein